MNFGLRILEMADNDVDEAAAFIARHSTHNALRFYDAVASTYKKIADAPKRWAVYDLPQPRWRDVRKRAVDGFENYLIFYRIDADMVEIIRVIHGARDIPRLFGDMA